MFFSLQTQSNPNYSNFYTFDNLVLSTDAGWTEIDAIESKIVYKGYSYTGPLVNHLTKIIDSSNPCVEGNFCVFHYNKETKITNIRYSIDRSFNLYYESNEITNLKASLQKISTDKLISNIDQNLTFTITDYDVLGTIDVSPRNYTDILESVYKILDAKVKSFLEHNVLPVQVYLSGGIDTMLVYSFIKKHTKNYSFAERAHIELDDFLAINHKYLQEHYWAYKQIHHWRNPTVLSSGAPGDEFMLRSPTTINLYLAANGVDALSLFDSKKEFLHKNYFQKAKHINIFNKQNSDLFLKKLVKSKVHTYKHICNVSSNDHQHHHLGNTLTFTPLRDLNILKLCLLLPLDCAIEQILNSTLSKDLIAMNDPSLLQYLTTDKNNQNYYPVYQFIKQAQTYLLVAL